MIQSTEAHSFQEPLIVRDTTIVLRTLFAILLSIDLALLTLYLIAYFRKRDSDDLRGTWNLAQTDVELGVARSHSWVALTYLLATSFLTLSQTAIYVQNVKRAGSTNLTDSGAILIGIGTILCLTYALIAPLELAILLRVCRVHFETMNPEKARSRTTAVAVAITHLLLLLAMGTTLPGPLITASIAANWIFLAAVGAAWSWLIVSLSLACCQAEWLAICQEGASFGVLVKRCYVVESLRRVLRGASGQRAVAVDKRYRMSIDTATTEASLGRVQSENSESR